jgi:hypothetical protein
MGRLLKQTPVVLLAISFVSSAFSEMNVSWSPCRGSQHPGYSADLQAAASGAGETFFNVKISKPQK